MRDQGCQSVPGFRFAHPGYGTHLKHENRSRAIYWVVQFGIVPNYNRRQIKITILPQAKIVDC